MNQTSKETFEKDKDKRTLIQKIKESVTAQIKCPSCNSSKITTHTITVERKPRKIFHLIGGLLLFIAGLILGWLTVKAFMDPVVMKYGNPAPMGMVAAVLLTSGLGLISRYFRVVRITQFKCKCKMCNNEWEDKKLGETLTLIESLYSENKDVRVKATRALGNINDSIVVEPLAHALNDENRDVRVEAVNALSKIGSIEAIKYIIDALKDKSWLVRWTAETKLNIASGKSENNSVRTIASEAIANIYRRKKSQ